MDFLLDLILHIDQYMIDIVQEYHMWAYAILFLIIFCETGSDSVPGTADLTQADAEQLAKEYVTSGDGAYKILDKVESDAPRTNKISVPRIGSVDIANGTVEKSGSTCYRVTVKGTTNAYDEYGQYLESFKYKYKLYIKTQVVGEPTVTNSIIGGTDESVMVYMQ